MKFLSSYWYTHSRTTSKILAGTRLSTDSTHSRSIYSLHSPTPPKYIFVSSISGNQVVVTLTLTLTLTLIHREISSLSIDQLVVTPNLTLTEKSIEADKHYFVLFSLTGVYIFNIIGLCLNICADFLCEIFFFRSD